MIIEPSEVRLPAGVLASSALVRVTQGTVYVPVVNVGQVDAMLFWNSVLGRLHSVFIVSLPFGIMKVKSVFASVNSQIPTALPSVQEQIKDLDLSVLTVAECEQVRSLLLKFHTIFSAHEGDLGCTRLISHDIPLIDSVHIRQRYQQIPQSEYNVV